MDAATGDRRGEGVGVKIHQAGIEEERDGWQRQGDGRKSRVLCMLECGRYGTGSLVRGEPCGRLERLAGGM